MIKSPKVGVIGLTGETVFLLADQIPIPGQTVMCYDKFFQYGGKGHNQAVACARAGTECVFIGAVGNDIQGTKCKTELESNNVHTYLAKKNKPTAFAVVLRDSNGENTVSVHGGAALDLNANDVFSKDALHALSDCDVLLVQNEISSECLISTLEIAKTTMAKVIYNPAPACQLDFNIINKFYALTPNKTEAIALAGIKVVNPSDKTFWQAFKNLGIKRAAITLGSEGVLLIEPSGYKRIESYYAGPVIDTTGAGDTFNGVLAAMVASKKTFLEAVEYAVIAAGISVTRTGTANCSPTISEINDHL